MNAADPLITTLPASGECLFWCYENEGEYRPVLLPFITQGVEREEKVLVFGQRSFFQSPSIKEIKADLKCHGLSGAGLLSAYLLNENGYGYRDFGDLAGFIKFIDRETRREAQKDGRPINLVIPVDVIFRRAAGAADVEEFLSSFKNLAFERRYRILALVDTRHVSLTSLSAILSTQSAISIQGTPFYLPPDSRRKNGQAIVQTAKSQGSLHQGGPSTFLEAIESQSGGAWIRKLFEEVVLGVIMVTPGGDIIEVNPQILRLLSDSPGVVRQGKLLDIIHPDHQTELNFWFQTLLRGNPDQPQLTLRLSRRDQEGIWVRMSGSYVSAPGDNTGFALLFIEDISEQIQMNEALHQQDLLLHEVLEKLPAGIWVADANGRLVISNREGEKIWGGERRVGQATLFSNAGSVKTDNCQPASAAIHGFVRALTKKEAALEELVEIRLRDGTQRFILDSTVPLFDAENRISGAISVSQDVTERKKIETELAQVQHRLLEHLEKERLIYAQDLHDGPIQDLYGVTYQLAELSETLQHTHLAETARSIQETLNEVISELRSFCNELRPPALAPFGVEKAIRSHAENYRIRHPGVEIHLDLIPDGQSLPETMRIALYRIYQELLNNVARHAEATRVDIRFTLEDPCVTLVVIDNGKGFTVPGRWVELGREGHLGLVGIYERAEALGGKVKVASQPGKGTTVSVTAQIPKQDKSADNKPINW